MIATGSREARPQRLLSARALAGRFDYTRLEFVCRRPAGWQPGVELADRLRGVVLHALEAPVRVWYKDSPRAPPFVPEIDFDGEAMALAIVLFGSAGRREREMAEALEAALRARIGPRAGAPGTLTVLDRRSAYYAAVKVPPPCAGVEIRLREPLSMRTGERDAGGAPSFAELVRGLANRAERLAARWIEPGIALDRRGLEAELAGCFQAPDLQSGALRRRAHGRHARHPMPVQGSLGRFLVEGRLDELAALLAIGAVVHAGGRVSMGYGRFDLAWAA